MGVQGVEELALIVVIVPHEGLGDRPDEPDHPERQQVIVPHEGLGDAVGAGEGPAAERGNRSP